MLGLCRLALSLLMIAFATAASAEAPATNSPLGLWFFQTSFPTGLGGELTLTRRGTRWHGEIAGVAAEAQAHGRDVALQFPNQGGLFRGTLNANGSLERGYWVRREMRDDPRFSEGAAQSYAGPINLRLAGGNRWQGDVHPLPDSFTLYLSIFRDSTGALKAAIRNPEQNHHGPAMVLDVTQQGDALRLSAPNRQGGPSAGTQTPAQGGGLEAHYVANPEHIELYWAEFEHTLTMMRATPAQRDLFSARPPGAAPYVYRVPQNMHDGWRIARARDLGVDERGLERAVGWITAIDPTAQRAWMVHSMAVAYRGRLILDEYFYGEDASTPHDLRSASKTFSSVILGAVMREGSRLSPDTRVYDVMAPLGPFANPDPRKAQITLGQAMTHTTGLACDDNTEDTGRPTSPGDEGEMQAQSQEPNWWRFTLNLPMAYDPGVHYAYCSGGINLAGGVLTLGTGEWLPALFDRTVARPLQFQNYYWNLMSNGDGYVGGGGRIRTRDFLKLGQTYLDGGVWNGRRIVSRDWVRRSLAAQVQINSATTGLEGDAFRRVYYEVPDGYAWHHIWVQSGDHRYQAYHANGNGGQLLLIVPEFDLAVMFTAGNYRSGLWNLERDAIVGDIIIPALPASRRSAQ
ncbi:MAG: serine hydrolase [Vitreimonas sp.]